MQRPLNQAKPTDIQQTYRYLTRHKLNSQCQANHISCVVFDDNTGKLLEYRHLIQDQRYKVIWEKSFANKLGRLAQGIRNIQGTNTIFYIDKVKIPKHKKVSYDRIVCDVRPQREEKERTRLTVGGDKLEYSGPVTTETADITTAKIIFSSVISTPGARFISFDTKNFYLGTPMTEYEYITLHINIIPQEIIDKYDLHKIKDKNG